jgi:hypothetical protein
LGNFDPHAHQIRLVQWNWEFSNGCTFELAVALDVGIPTLDHLGRILGRKDKIKSLERAIAKLSSEMVLRNELPVAFAKARLALTPGTPRSI